MNARGFLAPFRGQRYHLQEWGGSNRPRTAEEFFNMKHSKARNVIECVFGILKIRWALLRDTPWYSPEMVGLFFTACCILHNYIRQVGGPDVFEQAYFPLLQKTLHSSRLWTMFQCTWSHLQSGMSSGMDWLPKCGLVE
ncbi:hypothetical protein LINPERPRIM_LOCUS3748, partial [Linum perenne]